MKIRHFFEHPNKGTWLEIIANVEQGNDGLQVSDLKVNYVGVSEYADLTPMLDKISPKITDWVLENIDWNFIPDSNEDL